MNKRFYLRLSWGDLKLIDTKAKKVVRVYPNALRNELWNQAIKDLELLNSTEIIEVV